MLQFACEAFATPEQLLSDGCACDMSGWSNDDLLDILDEASDIVTIITGGRVTGRCIVTVRPCLMHHCNDGNVCGCSSDGLPLSGVDPEVLLVTVDGVTLSETEYMVQLGLGGVSTLVRRDGSWPTSQDLTLDDTEENTFSVTFEHGLHPGWVERQAAIELACAMARGALPSASRLTPGVRSSTMGGVSVQLEDMAEALKEGHGNLPRVARLIGKYAASGRGQSGVWSPEMGMGWSWVTVSPVSS